MSNKIDHYELIDKVNQAVTSPESIDPEEMERLMNDEEFVDLYKTAVDLRRVSMEHSSIPDSKEEFRRFEAAHAPTQRNTRLIWMSLTTIAACVVALFLLMSREKKQVDNTPYLYYAEQVVDDITITSNGKIVTMKDLHNPSKANVQGVRVNGDVIEYQPVSLHDMEITSSTIMVPQGKVAKIVLPDGSRVWLNARSSLLYPCQFTQGKPREVELKGEAFFEVTPDKNRPFIVKTGQLTTRVLGTSFNIRSYQGEQPCVTLVTGSVRVSANSATASSSILKPGEQWTMLDAISSVTTVDTDIYTCWRDGLFYFDGQPLRDIMIEIGRWYNMNVILGSNEHINDRLHFSGERNKSVEELIEQMNMICNTKIVIEGNVLKVY